MSISSNSNIAPFQRPLAHHVTHSSGEVPLVPTAPDYNATDEEVNVFFNSHMQKYNTHSLPNSNSSSSSSSSQSLRHTVPVNVSEFNSFPIPIPTNFQPIRHRRRNSADSLSPERDAFPPVAGSQFSFSSTSPKSAPAKSLSCYRQPKFSSLEEKRMFQKEIDVIVREIDQLLSISDDESKKETYSSRSILNPPSTTPSMSRTETKRGKRKNPPKPKTRATIITRSNRLRTLPACLPEADSTLVTQTASSVSTFTLTTTTSPISLGKRSRSDEVNQSPESIRLKKNTVTPEESLPSQLTVSLSPISTSALSHGKRPRSFEATQSPEEHKQKPLPLNWQFNQSRQHSSSKILPNLERDAAQAVQSTFKHSTPNNKKHPRAEGSDSHLSAATTPAQKKLNIVPLPEFSYRYDTTYRFKGFDCKLFTKGSLKNVFYLMPFQKEILKKGVKNGDVVLKFYKNKVRNAHSQNTLAQWNAYANQQRKFCEEAGLPFAKQYSYDPESTLAIEEQILLSCELDKHSLKYVQINMIPKKIMERLTQIREFFVQASLHKVALDCGLESFRRDNENKVYLSNFLHQREDDVLNFLFETIKEKLVCGNKNVYLYLIEPLQQRPELYHYFSTKIDQIK